jgi:catechol 2,3-dioxygenase-like lactoylglutathione lyase family enzyme
MSFQLQKASEVVFSVKNLKKAAANYTELLGWKEVHSGNVSRSLLDSYGLPKDATADEILLNFQRIDFGQIRLIQFNNIPQKYIRSGGKTWDIGGIMDIDLRVSDIDLIYRRLQDNGWHGYEDPVNQTMGPFTLRECVVRGHDEVNIAIVERTVPPLPNPDNLVGCISNVYLSALIVSNIDEAEDFYCNKLGFKLMNDINFRENHEGPSLFGLPHNLTDKVTAKLKIIAPTESRDSMFDLIEFEGVRGRDFTEYAIPPNLGILLYRIPVVNLAAYYDFIQTNGVKPYISMQTIDYQPVGQINQFAIRSRDGVIIEFWEGV